MSRAMLMLVALAGLALGLYYWLKKSGVNLVNPIAPPVLPAPAPSIGQKVVEQSGDSAAMLIGTISNGLAKTLDSWFSGSPASTEYGSYDAEYSSDGLSGEFTSL